MNASKARSAVQYTIRGIPANVDVALKRRAKDLGRSLNEIALEALRAASGEEPQDYHDLDFMFGSMTQADAKNAESEIARQRQIEPELWK